MYSFWHEFLIEIIVDEISVIHKDIIFKIAYTKFYENSVTKSEYIKTKN